MPLPRVSPRHVRAASSGEGWSAPRPRSFAWSQLQADQGAHSPVFPHQPPESWLAMREISQPAGSRGSFRRRREMFPDGSIPLQSNAIREEPHPAAHKPYDAEKARLVRARSDARVSCAPQHMCMLIASKSHDAVNTFSLIHPNPKPQTPTPNPKPQTPNPKPQTPNPEPQTLTRNERQFCTRMRAKKSGMSKV